MAARTVALWAGPRNGSTALMYSFAQRADTRVMDEPLFGHFLAFTGVDRPSRENVLRTMPLTAHDALASVAPRPSDQVVFLKHMANHLEGLDWRDVDGPQHTHVVPTRHPDGVLPSYGAHISHPTMLDLGYAHQLNLVKRIPDRALVVTAESLQARPEATLKALCRELSLSWDARMLSWTPGARPEDGVWAKHWYQGVHASSGWEPRTLKRGEVPAHLASLREECESHYLALKDLEISI